MASLGLTATTVNGTQFEELEDSPKIRLAKDGCTAQRRFRCSWDDWNTFAGELFGVRVNVGGTVSITQAVLFPGGQQQNLRVESVDIEPFDGTKPDGSSIISLTQGLPTHANGALIVASYKQVFASGGDTPTVPDGTYLTYDANDSIGYTTIPAGYWEWETDSTLLDHEANTGIITATTHHHLGWHNLLSVPETAISRAGGTVNNATFMGKPAGTMLFLGAKRTTAFAFDNREVIWNLDYTFAEKSQRDASDPTKVFGWNYFYRYKADGGTHWLKVRAHLAPQDNPYPSSDFSALFAYP